MQYDIEISKMHDNEEYMKKWLSTVHSTAVAYNNISIIMRNTL